MRINNIYINYVRNIIQVNVELGKRFNFFSGCNGSGKTSVLEAIYMLSTGNSFRTKNIHKVINTNSINCVVTGELYYTDKPPNKCIIGLEKGLDGTKKVKISGENINSAGELAKLLPLNLINSESVYIIDGEAKIRRQFLDWNLFHVEHSFFALWKDFTRVLQQRNSFLKQSRENNGKLDLIEMKFWDQKFIFDAKEIDLRRKKFLNEFNVTFSRVIKDFLPGININLVYQQGWEDNVTLEEAILAIRSKDCVVGFSTIGPHRADLSLRVGHRLAKDLLSRGQKKLLVAALLIARAKHLDEKYQQKCVFLVDDIQAELDAISCNIFMQSMANLECQVLVTGVNTHNLSNMVSHELCSLFHVEHGIIREEFPGGMHHSSL